MTFFVNFLADAITFSGVLNVSVRTRFSNRKAVLVLVTPLFVSAIIFVSEALVAISLRE